MTESRRDRWLSIAMSVLLHGTLIGLLVFGWWRFREHAPPPTLSIDATVVNARTLKGVGFATHPAARPKPRPSPPPAPVPQGPPVPTPEEQTLRELAAQAEKQHEAAARQELKKQQAARQAEEARQKREAAKARQTAQRLAEAKKKAAAKKRAEEKKLAEARKLAEEKKLAAERAAQEKAARAAALAELQRSLKQEEQSDAQARAGLASWTQEIEGRIEDAWIRPSTAKPGIDCVLDVTQVQGGTVTNVSIGRCNGDGAVRESIEAAVYRASPLPPPPDPSLFQRQLIIEFKPN